MEAGRQADGVGRPYPHVRRLTAHYHRGGPVLEIAAGAGIYRGDFERYVATDLPSTPYARAGLDVYCDARELPFIAGGFDLVFIVAALYMIPDPARVCRSAWLALRPGGSLLVFDYTEGTTRRALRNNLAAGRDREFHFWSGRELRRLLANAGFTDIRRHDASLPEGLLRRLSTRLSDRYGQWLIYRGGKCL